MEINYKNEDNEYKILYPVATFSVIKNIRLIVTGSKGIFCDGL